MAQRTQDTTLRRFGKTVQSMIQDVRLQGKLEQRFFTGIWLGKDTHTNESVLGIPGKIVKARTVRRTGRTREAQQATPGHNQRLPMESNKAYSGSTNLYATAQHNWDQHQHKQKRGAHRPLRSRKHWMHQHNMHHRA